MNQNSCILLVIIYNYTAPFDNYECKPWSRSGISWKSMLKEKHVFGTPLMTMLVNLSRRFLSLFFLCGILCLVNGARPSRLGAQLGMWRNVPTGCAAAATALARTNISPSGQGFWSCGEMLSCFLNSSSLRSTLSPEYKSADFQFINRILKPRYAAKCNEGCQSRRWIF